MPRMLSELLYAIVELGLPVAALSWLLFYRLYSRGVLARDADRKAIDERLEGNPQRRKGIRARVG